MVEFICHEQVRWMFDWLMIVFLNFYLLCFCNSSPDLQFLICTGSQQHCIKNPRPDQSCCDCCSCGWIHFFVGLPHPVGDNLVNLIYFFKWLWKFLNFFLLLSLLGNFDAEPHLSVTAVQRIPAMPNAEEEKRRRCRQKSWSACSCSRFPNPVFPFPLYIWMSIPSQVASPVSPLPLYLWIPISSLPKNLK